MAYLLQTDKPIPISTRPVDWLDLIGTWMLVGLVATGVWFEFQRHQRGQ